MRSIKLVHYITTTGVVHTLTHFAHGGTPVSHLNSCMLCHQAIYWPPLHVQEASFSFARPAAIRTLKNVALLPDTNLGYFSILTGYSLLA
jgi:hypothetical protein